MCILCLCINKQKKSEEIHQSSLAIWIVRLQEILTVFLLVFKIFSFFPQ